MARAFKAAKATVSSETVTRSNPSVEKIAETFLNKWKDSGVCPWVKPWSSRFGGGLSCNIHGDMYTGVNAMMLPAGIYGTYKQWQAEGGHVRKGETAFRVVFYTKYKRKDDDEDDAPRKCLKQYACFHLSQIEWPDGMPEHFYQYIDKEPPAREHVPDERIESTLSSYRDDHGILYQESDNGMCYYQPSTKSIHLQPAELFKSSEEYYSTKFHEHVHSTMPYLDRPCSSSGFGSKGYGREELCAEMGAYILMNLFGLNCKDSEANSIAYFENWQSAIKADPGMIIWAAHRAEDAAEYIYKYYTGIDLQETGAQPASL
jgi:antirestriction protein ArdC